MKKLLVILTMFISMSSFSQSIEGGVWEIENDYNWDKIDELIIESEALLIVNDFTLFLFHQTITEFFNFTHVTFYEGNVYISSLVNDDVGKFWVITDHNGWRAKINFVDMKHILRVRLKYINDSTIEIINESPIYQKYFDVLKRNPRLKRRTT